MRQVGGGKGTFRTKGHFRAPSKGREATQLAIAQASCLKQLRELCLKAHSACFMPGTPRFLFWGEMLERGDKMELECCREEKFFSFWNMLISEKEIFQMGQEIFSLFSMVGQFLSLDLSKFKMR